MYVSIPNDSLGSQEFVVGQFVIYWNHDQIFSWCKKSVTHE